MFLGWILDHNLYAPEFWEDSAGYVASFRTREMTGARVFEYACDGVLDDEMLNSEGNAFAYDYFDFERGRNLQDYEQLLSGGLPSLYHVKDTWRNYHLIAERISERYDEWKRVRKG
jgi:hypothetical protein